MHMANIAFKRDKIWHFNQPNYIVYVKKTGFFFIFFCTRNSTTSVHTLSEFTTQPHLGEWDITKKVHPFSILPTKFIKYPLVR